MIDRAFDVDVENMESNPMNLRTAEREGSSGVEEKVVEISHNIDSSTGNVLKSKKQRRLSSRELMRETHRPKACIEYPSIRGTRLRTEKHFMKI